MTSITDTYAKFLIRKMQENDSNNICLFEMYYTNYLFGHSYIVT